MENQTLTSGGENRLELTEVTKQLDVKWSNLNGSNFKQFCMDGSVLQDVSAKNVKIADANLSDLEIEGAQLGGAFIHNIGMPPQGHPAYDPAAKQRPLRFENCDLNGTTFADCNLSGVEISDCDISGLKINGVLIAELLKR